MATAGNRKKWSLFGAFPNLRDWGSGPGLGGWGAEGEPGASATGPDRTEDRRILDEINERVKSVQEIDSTDVEVRVESGQITLTGTVPAAAMRQLIEQCAVNIKGVKAVSNQILIQHTDTAVMGSE